MSKASKGNKLRAAIADEEAADGSADGGVNLSPDTWARMSKLIDTSVASKIKEYTEQTAKSFNSVNLKLVDIGKRIEGLQGQYQTEIDSIRARLEDPDVSRAANLLDLSHVACDAHNWTSRVVDARY